ncbi:MAG TPA: adenylosuccinate lyase [Luteibaculaceae bacterium]|jgi:adenylosuccinate lyase|nr:adenylosuccinate lyase [Luteibaculaceae bacterium]
MLNALTAISPIDGRYHNATSELSAYFSEAALIRYRVYVEIEYFIALCELPLPQLASFDKAQFSRLRSIHTGFSLEDAQTIKNTEKITNHDVKAVEYFIKEKLDEMGLGQYKEFVHFGLTSQDINNTSVPKSLLDAVQEVYLPGLLRIAEEISRMSQEWRNIPLLARTHGQPASPTVLGKEMKVFAERLDEQIATLRLIKYAAKFGGATGNFNAHAIAYPQIDWVAFANQFVNGTLGLNRSQTTTQIEHYDHMAALFDVMKRINTILIDFNRDMWTYISMDYFKQKIKEGEVGSSAMPHKVNPIDFENSEGNLGMANAIFEHLSAKLPISRLQRDLTDSTVLRNIGVPFSHTLIGFKSTLRGISKLLLNAEAIEADLDGNWAVVAEAIQTILRREGYPKPYEALKELTRVNSKITADTLAAFIDTLNVSESVKAEMKRITPANYIGVKLV